MQKYTFKSFGMYGQFYDQTGQEVHHLSAVIAEAVPEDFGLDCRQFRRTGGVSG